MPSHRSSRYDSDYERLPTGMIRIGYDADDQTYTFRDTDGSIWESAPGNEYGTLSCVARPQNPPSGNYGHYNDGNGDEDGDDDDDVPPPHVNKESLYTETSWRAEMMPLLSFFMVISLFLLGVFYYLRWSAAKTDRKVELLQCEEGNVVYNVQPGDTCWGISNDRGLSVDAILRGNENLDCDKLMAGQSICVPLT